MLVLQKALSTKSKERLQQLIVVLNKVVKEGIEIEKHFTEEHFPDFLFIRVNLFSRFIHRMDTISILWNEWIYKPAIEEDIGLLIRTGLLDFTHLLYLDSFHIEVTPQNKKAEEILNEETISYLCDHIYRTFWFAKTFKNGLLINEEKYKTIIDKMNKNWSGLMSNGKIDYTKPELNIVGKRFQKSVEIFKRICNHPATKQYTSIFDCYEYYSKYEHWGIMTNQMQTRDMDEQFLHMSQSLHFLILGSLFCLEHLQKNIKSLVGDEMKKMVKLKEEYYRILSTSE